MRAVALQTATGTVQAVGARKGSSLMAGTTPARFDTHDQTPADGRLFAPIEARAGAAVCGIGTTVRREVVSPFLVEAVALAALGSKVGIAGATAAATGLTALMGGPRAFGAAIDLLSFDFAAAIGVDSGYSPACHVAQLDPMDALRHE